MAKNLVVKGSTKKLKGFQSKKTGKEINAKLTLKADKLAFEF